MSDQSKAERPQDELAHQREEDARPAVRVGGTDQEPIYTKAYTIFKPKPPEQVVKEALSELSEEPPLRAALEQGSDPAVLERLKIRKKYGQRITDLHNILKGSRSTTEQKVHAGMVLIDEYERRMRDGGSGQRRREYQEKIKEIESLLEKMPKSAGLQERDFTRDAARITLARVPEYQDRHPLHAETQEEGEKKFQALTREAWKKELVVHGILETDRETGQVRLRKKTDLDGKVALGLLKLAGIDAHLNNDVEYVRAGEERKGKINIDTGHRDGMVVEDEGATAYFDHHTTESGHENSASKITYEVLTRLGLLESRRDLEALVEFVTKCDNMAYGPEAYGAKSFNTLVGLRNHLNFNQLNYFFRKGQNPLLPIPEDELKSTVVLKETKGEKGEVARQQKTLFEVSEERKKAIAASETRLKEMEGQGLIIESKQYGKIAVDIDGTVKNGVDAAKAYGAGAFIKWMPKTESFFVTTLGRPLKAKFSQGIPVRDTMWIKPRTDGQPLSAKLSEVLGALAGRELAPSGELKKYLDQESPEAGEAELRRMVEEAVDAQLAGQLDKLGMTEAEKKFAREEDLLFRRRRDEMIKELLAEAKKDL